MSAPGCKPGPFGAWVAAPSAQSATVGPDFANVRLPLHKVPHAKEHTKRALCAQTAPGNWVKMPGVHPIRAALPRGALPCCRCGKKWAPCIFLDIFDGFHVSAGHCCAVQSVLSRVHRCLIQMLTTSPGSCLSQILSVPGCATGPFWFGLATPSAQNPTKVHIFPDIGLPLSTSPHAGGIKK